MVCTKAPGEITRHRDLNDIICPASGAAGCQRSFRTRNDPVKKSMESVMRSEESLWWERLVKEVGFKLEEKERGSYGW